MTSPMTTVTALARRFAVDVDINPSGAANWQPLLAIESIKTLFAPRRVADESYDDAGAGRMAVTGSQWSIDLKIIHRAGSDGVTMNATQEYLRTQSEKTDAMSGEVHVRWYDRSGVGEAWDGRCLVDWTPDGGAGAARDTVTVKLNGQGAKASITNPNSSPLPVVALLTPTAVGVAGGAMVQVRGRKFTGATACTFGGTAAGAFTIADDGLIVATAPAKTAGTYDIVVTTPGGASATSAASKVTYS